MDNNFIPNKVHEVALEILKNELFKLGGKLFSVAAIEHFTKIKANEGDKEAEEALKVANFVNSLFSNFNYSLDSRSKRDFDSLVSTIVFLNEQQKKHS